MIVVTLLLWLRIPSQSKLQRRRQTEIALQILPIVKNCELFRRSCNVLSTLVQTIGAMLALRTYINEHIKLALEEVMLWA